MKSNTVEYQAFCVVFRVIRKECLHLREEKGASNNADKSTQKDSCKWTSFSEKLFSREEMAFANKFINIFFEK